MCCLLGEPFTQEEMEEMLSAAMDPEKGTILYKDYASVMALEETWDIVTVMHIYLMDFFVSFMALLLWLSFEIKLLTLIALYTHNVISLLSRYFM